MDNEPVKTAEEVIREIDDIIEVCIYKMKIFLNEENPPLRLVRISCELLIRSENCSSRLGGTY